jgi:phage portal protein BeeE
VFQRYAANLSAAGGVPTSVLEHPDELTAEAAQLLQQQWVEARVAGLGLPAVLSGGVTWRATQLNPNDMALVELSQFNDARIATMLGVPPFLVGLPSGGDSMTYSNVSSIFDYHWRAGLRPKAHSVMSALSGWLLPRGTRVEVNRDEYVQPEPLVRAQTAEILNRITDEFGRPVLSVDEIRLAERLTNTVPADLSQGVLR